MTYSRRRYAAGAALGVAVLLTATACGSASGSGTNASGGAPVKGGVLNMLGAGDVDFMDPNVSYYSIGYQALRLWSRQLFAYPAEAGKTTTAVPDLAEQVPTQANGGISADGTTYTITIRNGAMWDSSPARQVTAADLVRGVKRTCNPVQPFGGTPDFADLITGYQSFCKGFAKVPQNPKAIADYVDKTPLPGVVAKDDRTVVFHLNHPATYFVDMLTLPAFSPAPVEVMQYLPGSLQLGQHEIADGPYQVQTWQPTKQIVFTRNPAWSSATDPVRHAYVDKVVVNETVSQDSTQQQLQTGTPAADMEFDNFPPPSKVPALIASKDPNFNLGPTDSSNPYLIFNMKSPTANGALQNLQVREALEYAINRDDILQVLGGAKQNPPLTHVLPSGVVGSKDFDLYPYDPGKAKQLLSAAGHGSGLTLKLLYRNQSDGSSKAFQVIQQDLGKVGIKVQGVASPNADFYTKYLQQPSAASSGTWDLALAGWAPDWYGNSALSFFAPLFNGASAFPPVGSNYGFYDDPKATKLIQEASSAADEGQAAALWAQADRQVMQDAPFFPITEPLQPNYHAAQVHNAVYIPALQNFDPANVWLEPGKNGD